MNCECNKKCNFDEVIVNIANIYRVYCECKLNIIANVLRTSRLYTECNGIANASLLRPRNGDINHSAEHGKSAAHQSTPALWHQRLLKQLS